MVGCGAVIEDRNVMDQYAANVDYKGYHQTNMWALLKLFSYAIGKSGPAASAPVVGNDMISAYQTAVKDVTLDGLLPQPITYSESGTRL